MPSGKENLQKRNERILDKAIGFAGATAASGSIGGWSKWNR